MRLLCCEIQNFGCLSGFSLSFEPGLNTLQQANGFGKTTLAVFIRCMFYGMPRSNQLLDRDLRRKYRPWQGGAYGGTLDFEEHGHCYRIARSFGDRPAQDSFCLYTLPGLEKSNAYSKSIGTELFGVDDEAFARTTCVTQNSDGATGWNLPGIQARLTEAAEGSSDLADGTRALEALKKKRNELIPSRGQGGTVATANRALAQLEDEIARANSARDSLEGASEEVRSLNEEIARGERKRLELQERINRAAAAQVHARDLQDYLRIKGDLETHEGRLAALQRQYPQGLPDEDDLRAASGALDALASAAAGSIGQGAYEAACKTEASLTEMFSEGIPEQATLDAMQADYRRWLQLTAKRDSLGPTEAELQRFSDLQETFSGGMPVPEPKPQETLQNDGDDDNGRPKRTHLLLLGAGLLLVVVGVLLLVCKRYALGGCIAGLGLAAICGAGYLNLRSMLLARTARQDRPVDSDRLQREAQQRQAYQEYHCLAAQIHEAKQQLGELNRQTELLEERLMAFICTYEPYAEMQACGDALLRIREAAARLREARTLLAEERSRRQKAARESAHYEAELTRVFDRDGMRTMPKTRETIDVLREALRQKREAEAALPSLRRQLAELPAELAEEAAALAAGKHNSEPEPGAVEALRKRELALNEKLGQAREELAARRSSLAKTRRQADELGTLLDRQARLKQQLAHDSRRATLLDRTTSYLEQAQKQLRETYSGGVERAFHGYLTRLAPFLSAEPVHVDGSLGVALERGGIPRETAAFSAGSADLIRLCMRLAIVDALYEGAKPLVILDDPFVNLDDENTARALAVLQELGEDHQLLYLVCNSSRC